MAQSLPLLRASVLSFITLSLVPCAAAIDLNTSSHDSIAATAQTIANSLITTYYNVNSTAGDFNQPEPWCQYKPHPSTQTDPTPSSYTARG